MEALVQLGVMREAARATGVFLWECERQEYVEPLWVADPQTGGRRAIYCCCHEDCDGMHVIDPDRFRVWKLSFDGVLTAVGRAIGAIGGGEVAAPDRIGYVGAATRNGVLREVFLARALMEHDAAVVLAQAQRLRSSPAPAILVEGRLPQPSLWVQIKPAIASLAELVTLDDDGTMSVAIEPLLCQECVPHPDAAATTWLTVTEAAELLVKDLLGLTLEQARARVSVAAGRGAFRTNGHLRSQRRIDRTTFDAWRLAQRDKDLAQEDADDDADIGCSAVSRGANQRPPSRR